MGPVWRWLRIAHTSDAWVVIIVFKVYHCLSPAAVSAWTHCSPQTSLGFPSQRKSWGLTPAPDFWHDLLSVYLGNTPSLFILLCLHWLTCLHTCRHTRASWPLQWLCSASCSFSSTQVDHYFISFRFVVKSLNLSRKTLLDPQPKLHLFFHPQIIPSSSLFDFTTLIWIWHTPRFTEVSVHCLSFVHCADVNH